MPSTTDAQDTTDAFVADVVNHLSQRLPDLVDAMCNRVQQDLPLFRRRNADAEELRGGMRRTAVLWLRSLEEHRPLRADELVTMHVIGAQRARQGIPSDCMVEGVRLALRVAWQFLLDVVAELPPNKAMLPAVGRMSLEMFDFAQVVVDALNAGFATEQEQRLTGRVQAQAAFVDRLLEGHWDDDREIRSQAAVLGHDLGRSCGMLLVLPAAGQDTEALRHGAAAVVGAVPGVMEGPMRSLPTLHVILLLPSPSPSKWGEYLDVAARVAATERLVIVPSEATAEAGGLVNVYRRAQRYLTLAHAVESGPGLVTVKELRLYAVLAGVPLGDRVEFVKDMLGPVLDLPYHRATELLDTLEAVYRRKGRIAEAAADLHLHTNSVRYRLNRIEELTGLSLDVPAERLHLELAMRLRGVATTELGALDDQHLHSSRSLPA